MSPSTEPDNTRADGDGRSVAFPEVIATPGQRLDWVDGARGVGIVLVVLGHALAGLIDAGMQPAGNIFPVIHSAIYVFHMPLFFMVSGLFTSRRATVAPVRFARSWWLDLVYPMIVWSILTASVRALSPLPLNHATPPLTSVILSLPYTPIAPFWFIYALVLLHMAATAMTIARMGRLAPALLVGLSVLYSLPDMPTLAMQTLRMAPWYAAGLWLGGQGSVLSAIGRHSWREALVLLGIFSGMFWLGGPQHAPEWALAIKGEAAAIADLSLESRFYPIATLGIGAAIACAQATPGLIRETLRYLGQRTMAIYVMHVIIVAGMRVLLRRIGVSEPYTLLLLTTLAGIGIPLVGFEIASRMGISRWVGLGRPLHRA